jgi:hypothetical protein
LSLLNSGFNTSFTETLKPTFAEEERKRSRNGEWSNSAADTLVLNRLNGEIASYGALQYLRLLCEA